MSQKTIDPRTVCALLNADDTGPRQAMIEFKDGGRDKRAGSSFYRGETININPYRTDYRQSGGRASARARARARTHRA